LSSQALIEQLRAAQAQDPALGVLLAGLFSPDGRDPNVLRFNVNVGLEVRGPDGALKDRRELHNLIVTAGKQLLLASGGTAKYVKDFAYVAIGTGTTAAALGDTTLGTESARALGTVSNPDANTLRITYTFPAGTGTGAITEAGLLSAAAAGTLLARQVFAAVNKGASDTLAVTFDLT
jgi:hypothetical protein